MLNSRARVQIPAHPKIFPRKFFPKEFLGASRESNPDHREIKKKCFELGLHISELLFFSPQAQSFQQLYFWS
jgi:hypothetical protein